MIFSCWEQVAYLSTVFTLEPGDIISTGTPAGVGMGFDPPRWLVDGRRGAHRDRRHRGAREPRCRPSRRTS